MIVDCHTHWNMDFWQEENPDPWSWWEVPGRNGVDHAVVLPTAGLCDDMKLKLENDRIHQVCAASGGRMIPFCSVKPAQGDEALAELARCVENMGCRGLKIHPWLQGTSINSSQMDRICEALAEYDIPVLFHDGTPCTSLPSQVGLLARRHPKVKVILGHIGILEHWREAIEVLRQESNVWGCLCGPHVAGIREILSRCDRGRLLWASDYGYNTSDPIAYRLGLLKIQDINDRDLEMILEHNPRRLLAL